MAKRTKTNKTDHVLNLLASGSKKSHSDSDGSAPPVDLKKKSGSAEEISGETEVLEETTKKQNQAEAGVNEDSEFSEASECHEIPEVSVVHLSGEENPLAETVKKSLEAELESYLEENSENRQKPLKEQKLSEEPTEPAEKPVVEEARQEAKPPMPEQEEVVQPQMPESKEEPQHQEAETAQVAESASEEATALSQELEQEKETAEETVVEEEQEKPAFLAVNVMEQLVRSQVEGFIKQFGHCSCRRCVEDTTALALTHLPAKYVVVTKESVSPLLNFYEKKYAGQLIVEITKASMTVSENPHH